MLLLHCREPNPVQTGFHKSIYLQRSSEETREGSLPSEDTFLQAGTKDGPDICSRPGGIIHINVQMLPCQQDLQKLSDPTNADIMSA